MSRARLAAILAILSIPLGCQPVTPGDPSSATVPAQTGSDQATSRNHGIPGEHAPSWRTLVDVAGDTIQVFHLMASGQQMLRWFQPDRHDGGYKDLFDPKDLRDTEGRIVGQADGFNVIDGTVYLTVGQTAKIYEYRLHGHLTPRHHYHVQNIGVTTLTVGDKIYLYGGYDGEYGVILASQLLVYEPARQTMRELASNPLSQPHAALTHLDGKIYVIGGQSDSLKDHPITNAVQAYDIATNRWEAKASLSTPRQFAAATALDGKIYVFGGDDGRGSSKTRQNFLDSVEIYDPLQDTWTPGKPMPVRRAGLAATVLKGQIYLFGGDFQDLSRNSPYGPYSSEPYHP